MFIFCSNLNIISSHLSNYC